MMGAWAWPRALAALIALLLVASTILQPASRWDRWLQEQAPVTVDQLGPTLAAVAMKGSSTLLQAVPHVAWLPSGRGPAILPVVLQVWSVWPARAALHAAALALWLGLCSPALLITVRRRRVLAGPPPPAAALNTHLGSVLTWPLWRRALGLLPLATLVWSTTAASSLALAPGLASLWLILAGALWWPNTNHSVA